MQTILITINASPYGSERSLSALRLASALFTTDTPPRLRIFLLSDAVGIALANQKTPVNPSLEEMVRQLLDLGAEVRVCRTCVEARGLEQADWLKGVVIGTMPELARWILEADKVISF